MPKKIVKKEKVVKQNPLGPGSLLDDRPDELKAKDFMSHNPELAAAPGYTWKTIPQEEWINNPARDQDGSSTCVEQALQKAYYMLTGKITSAHPGYLSRKNFPDPGMYLYDAGDLAKKLGTVLESDDPSQKLSEAQMNKTLSKDVIQKLNSGAIKIGAYVFVNDYKNIDAIAQAIETYGHCIITVGSNYAEWQSIPVVQGKVDWYHCICAVQYFLYNGEKVIMVDESWGPGATQFGARRLLTQDFLRERATGAMYITLPVPPSPVHHVFTQTLKLGNVGPEVQALQEALKSLGFFPQIATTTYFGPVTQAAVNKFQLAYKDEILTPAGLTAPTGIFGPNSIKKMNSLLQ